MSLDISRLENARQRGTRIIARCPACAEHGHDEKGQHLVIMGNGSFGCVVHPGAAGKSHRQRIFAMAGDENSRKRGSFMVRVRRPSHAVTPKADGEVVHLGQLGTLGTPFQNPRATREQNTLSDAQHRTCNPYTHSVAQNASQASQPVPCHETAPLPLNADALSPAEIIETTSRMLGGLAPYLIHGIAQHQAWLYAVTLGVNPEDSEIAMHLDDIDPSIEAVSVVHAGMVFLAALKVGLTPKEAGETAVQTISGILGINRGNPDDPF